MSRRLTCAFLLNALLVGCAAARSYGVGETIGALSTGQSAISIAGGATAMASIPPPGTSFSTNNFGVSFPSIEGALGHALTPWMALNLHGGPDGIEPGLRFTTRWSGIDFTAQPQLGLGFRWSQDRGTTDNELLLGPGARLQAAFPQGNVIQLGFTEQRLISIGTTGSTGEHDFSVVLGWNAQLGRIQVGPEAALLFAWSPDLGRQTWFGFLGLALRLQAPESAPR